MKKTLQKKRRRADAAREELVRDSRKANGAASGPGGPGIAEQVAAAVEAVAPKRPPTADQLFDLLTAECLKDDAGNRTGQVLRAVNHLGARDALRMISLLPLERQLSNALESMGRAEMLANPDHVKRLEAFHRLTSMTLHAFVDRAEAIASSVKAARARRA